MLFKMILDAAGEEERPLVRGFLRHLLAGFAGGLAFGALGLVVILALLGRFEISIPWVFFLAMMLQMGTIGGLVGVGVYMSRKTDRSVERPKMPKQDDAPLSS